MVIMLAWPSRDTRIIVINKETVVMNKTVKHIYNKMSCIHLKPYTTKLAIKKDIHYLQTV